MRILLSAVLISFLCLNPVFAAGPFGFEQGHSPSEYRCVKSTTEGIFTCDAPKPHPAFETYAVQAEENIGICWVKGIGKDLTTSGSGIALRGKAREIADQISTTYGAYTSSDDTVMSGSIWDDFEDWTMANLKDELIYFYQWDLKGQKQVNGVKTIFVSAKASGKNEGFPIAEFAFTNEPQCDAAKKKREAGAF